MMLTVARLSRLVLFLLLAGSASAWAAPEPDRLEQAAQRLADVERQMGDAPPHTAVPLKDHLQTVTDVRALADQCAKQTQERANEVKEAVQVLGPPAEDEAPDVQRERQRLSQEQTQVEQRLSTCRLLGLRAQNLANQINERQRDILAQRLLAQGPHLIEVLRADREHPDEEERSLVAVLYQDSDLDLLTPGRALLLLGAALVALLTGLAGRTRLKRRAAAIEGGDLPDAGFLRALLACTGHYLPHLLIFATSSLALTVMLRGQWPWPFITALSYGLGVYYLLLTLIRTALRPCPPARLYLDWPAPLARTLARRLQVLSLLLLFGFLFFAPLLSRSLPETAILLARAVYGLALFLNLSWITLLVGRLPSWRGTAPVQLAVIAALGVGLLAEWAGYRNLSVFILRGLSGTLLGIGVVLVLSHVLRELYDGLDEPQLPWQRRLRRWLGIGPDAYVPGLVWLRLLSGLVLWSILILWALRVWGLPDTGFDLILQRFNDGFEIGDWAIVPRRILMALLFFALLLAVSSWFSQRLAQRWIYKTRMDRGAREAIVTISRYLGVLLAVLIALSVAGVSFTNLALIAGALSVGIGFGLQNIVNNFVSGLVLLFERPIKTGDWIVVGQTEGHVKRISLRSTQLQTFDRADVIIPNADLVSGLVTNWMLNDPWGRVTVPVSVARGTDTGQVKRILLELAEAHSQVVSGHALVPDPVVLFMSFSDYALQFELRCFIRNVDERLGVRSDLYFAIDEAFRQNGIEVPLPQRVVHLHEPQARPGPDAPSGATD